MKKSIIITFFTLFTLCVCSQEKSNFTIGGGIPFLFAKFNYSYSAGEVYFGNKKFNFFIEKPRAIQFKNNEQVWLTPGVSLLTLNEIEGSGALGGQSGKKYKRTAISVYTKFLINPVFLQTKVVSGNIGVVTGVYLYTKAKGKSEWHINYTNGYYAGSEEINTNSKAFFKSTYLGLVANININQNLIKWLNPGIEISFYPDFANIIDSHSGVNFDTDLSRSMLMASLKLGLKTKKAAQK